ncbi:MAG TPA: S8 family serine peptidase [Actinomycetales bacterium]|nr:S8 family serine peptidase [Actinomycetales bacterium]
MTRLAVVRAVVSVAAAALTAGAAAAPPSAPVTMTVDGELPSCTAGQSEWISEPSWVVNRLGTRDAWPLSGRGEGVVVAVVDGGVDDRNPHLEGQVLPGTSFVSAQAEPEGTFDGTTDFINHGTAIASLIAAKPVPESGMVGIAPRAEILPVRFFSSDDEKDLAAGDGPTVERLAQGIRWAADNGADIINVSISQSGPAPELEAAVDHAQSLDVLVVASAGNRGDDDAPDALRWPAAYDGVLGVTPTNRADRVTDASLHSAAVDVAAPGQDLTAALLDRRDCVYAQGEEPPATSWATGYVSGAAALVQAAHPDETADQIAYRLMATADRPLRDERDDAQGWGFVQPYQAIVMTFDATRPGPTLPGAEEQEVVPEVEQIAGIAPLTDPLADRRDDVIWWGLLGLAGLGLLLLLTRWNRLTRPREQ